MWERIDSAAHVLYAPTALGKRCLPQRWHHHLHLIPGRLLARICDAYDRSLGMTDDEIRGGYA
jgi:hypothetical protein